LRAHKFSFDQLADDVIAVDAAIKSKQSVPFMRQYLGIAENIAEEIRDANKALTQDKAKELPEEKKTKPQTVVPIPSSSDFA